jgi:hypothetical protein
MVDLPLGEKQASVDYSKSKAFETTNVKRVRKILDIYDIMCQYYKKLGLRFDLSEFLTMPEFIVEKAIGQFHVHGHKDVCYFRFSTAFIPGAGQVDGEVLETLWGVLNKISWSARTTTLAHRAEILDDHTNDSNWKKMTNIGAFFMLTGCIDSKHRPVVSSVIGKYHRAIENSEDSSAYFAGLCRSADVELQRQWEATISAAEANRIADPAAMDVMGNRLKKTGLWTSQLSWPSLQLIFSLHSANPC